jgi:hypothetical protein
VRGPIAVLRRNLQMTQPGEPEGTLEQGRLADRAATEPRRAAPRLAGGVVVAPQVRQAAGGQGGDHLEVAAAAKAALDEPGNPCGP